MKQTIDECLADYTTKELIQFHANINSLFLCCNEDFKLFKLLMELQFAVAARKEKIAKDYLDAVNKILTTAN
jgi:hypothetical protein